MLTAQNAKSIMEGWDLVIDGTDNLPTRYLVDDCCRLLGKPWVYGSIYRFEGQVSVFNYNNGPCYRIYSQHRRHRTQFLLVLKEGPRYPAGSYWLNSSN